jgi:hypothetical protein
MTTKNRGDVNFEDLAAAGSDLHAVIEERPEDR